MGAEELAGEQIGVIADALPVFYILASAQQNRIGLFPQLLGDDGWDDLAGFILEHDPFLRREEFLLLREHVHDLDLVADVVALVFGVGNQVGHGGVRDFFAVVVAIALVPEQCL